MNRLCYDIAARLDATTDWSIADTDEDWIAVWHSNGDDQCHFTRVKGEWFTYTTYNNEQTEPVTPLPGVSASDAANLDVVTGAMLQRLTAWDPICEGCGFQGHNDGPTCKG